MNILCNNHKPDGKGGSINRPVPVSGPLMCEWWEQVEKNSSKMWHYIMFNDGRIFRRPSDYWDKTPHGWDRCVADESKAVA